MLNNKIQNNIKLIIWLIFNIIILIYGTYLRHIGPDGAVVFIYFMYFISFPLGLVIPFVFVCIDKCIGYDINIYYEDFPIIIDIFFPWVLFLFVGYFQWFVLIPKIKKLMIKV